MFSPHSSISTSFPGSPGLGEARGRWDDPLLFLPYPQQPKPSLLPTFSAPHPFSCVAHTKSQWMREHLILIYSEFLQLPLLARALYVIGNRVQATCPHPTASPSWAPAGRYGQKSGLLQHLCLGRPIENVFLNIAR